MKKESAKRIFKESPEWLKTELIEEFGDECFKENSFKEIKTVEDACQAIELTQKSLLNSELTSDEINYRRLKVVAKAINQGWEPDWNNTNQRKWWPYFNMSSGFGFSYSFCGYANTPAYVGSRLCFETEEKSNYAGTQFLELYKEFLTISK